MTPESFSAYQAGQYERVAKVQVWSEEEELGINWDKFITESLFGSTEVRRAHASRLYALAKEYTDGLLVVAEISLTRAKEILNQSLETSAKAVEASQAQVRKPPSKPTQVQLGSYQPDSAHQQLYHRKYWKTNLTGSEYFGLLMSRMYMGSWAIDSMEQDFTYKCKDNSLAAFMRDSTSSSASINIFVGSSYATHEMVKWMSSLSRGKKYRLFALGILPKNS